MSNNTFSSYTAANSIDASADYLLISPSNGNVYKRINRNTFLALASAPLGLTDIQSPQNKIFDNTNSLTVKDGSLTIQNSSSTTKQAVFSASGITAGQTRTFTFPDASGTLATIAGTQTLTNKTITSPAITGGTIDNSTITVDSISGHTVATTVTVANLQIANGVLNTANAVTATSVANGAIQPQALVAGTGSGWSMSSWTPTWTNLTPGNATVSAKYVQVGKVVFARVSVILGNTSSVGGAISFTLPVTSISYPGSATVQNLGQSFIYDVSSATLFNGGVYWLTTTTAKLRWFQVAGTAISDTDTSSTAPMTWANPDEIFMNFWYEAA